MKILVLGWYYSDNLGDAVLTECTAALLCRQYPQAEVVVRDLMGRQQFPQRKFIPMTLRLRHWVRSGIRRLASHMGWDKQLKRDMRGLSRRIDDISGITAGDWDAVVFAGGQLFMDGIALYVADAVNRLQQGGIPVFFNACGLGPSASRTMRKGLIAALKRDNVHYLSCRDDVARLNRWCGSNVSVPVSDPALYTAEVFGVRKNTHARTVGLGIMLADTMPLASSYRFWRRMIRLLQKRQIPWKIFTNGREADMEFARQIIASLPELSGPAEDYLCPAPEKPAELVELIASFESLISYRLHSHIIACSLDIPTVAIQWDRKVPIFFEKIGCPRRCLTPKASPRKVLDRLQQARETGYDREAIYRQQQDACKKLFDAMNPYLKDRETL